MMFVTTLDVIWFGKKQQNVDLKSYMASSRIQDISFNMLGTIGHVFVKGDGKVYGDSNCTKSITSIIIPTKSGYKITGIYRESTMIIDQN